jgi:IS605 OrfB family transposase
MRLTLKIKLLPTVEQSKLLLETLKEANLACDAISDVAWEKRVFNCYKLHHQVYYSIKAQYKLNSEMIVRSIAKVANSYKVDKKTKRVFKPLGAIAYDSRILNYRKNNIVSLWCIGGRQKIDYVCHNSKYLPYIKGEADLVYKKGKFYLFQCVEVPEENLEDVEEFIGVDFGLTDIIVTSDGTTHSATNLNQYREQKQKIRSSIQAKATISKRSTTRNCRKLAKRLSGRERTHATITNHTIAKQLILSAKRKDKGVAIENLTNIRTTSKPEKRNKKFRTKLGKWSFSQLRQFIEYKGILFGVPVMVVNPRYTSQMCNVCKHIGKRTNKVFKCKNTNCEVDVIDADFNAAKNIASLGVAINQPEKSNDVCCSTSHIHLGLKPASCLAKVG